MKNAGLMATMAPAMAGAATIAAQESGAQRSGQGQQQPGSTRGADQQQTTGQQTGMITVTGCVQGGANAAGAAKTSGYTLMASAAGQRTGSGTAGAGAGSPG